MRAGWSRMTLSAALPAQNIVFIYYVAVEVFIKKSVTTYVWLYNQWQTAKNSHIWKST